MDDMRKKHGWQNCPKCKAMVEKTDGCDHMDYIVASANNAISVAKPLDVDKGVQNEIVDTTFSTLAK